MPAVFSRQNSYWAGSFASDIGALAIAGVTTVPLGIVQSFNATTTQNISRVYDIGNGGAGKAGGAVPVYYVGGRTQGNLTLGRVVGPKSGDLCNFYAQMGNVCEPKNLVFNLSAGCGFPNGPAPGKGQAAPAKNKGNNNGVNTVTYGFEGCVATQIGVTVNANDMMVNESLQLMFVNMSCTPGM